MATPPNVPQYMSAHPQNQCDNNIDIGKDSDCHATDGYSSIPREEVQGMDRQDVVVGNSSCDDQNKKAVQPVDGMLSVECHSAVK